MLEHRRVQTESQQYQKTMLYRLVFCSNYTKFLTFVVFSFLLLQPFSPAFAAFGDAEPQSTSDTANTEVLHPEVVATSSAVEAQEQQQVVNTQSASSTPSGVVLEASTTKKLSTSTPLGENIHATSTVQATSTPPNSTVAVIAATTSTSTVASSSPEIGEHSSAAFEFNAKECALVGNGAYYCNSIKKQQDPLQDGVFSAPDSEGDLEIFVRLHGKEVKVTSNNVDDSAPYYDAVSKRIVWQSLVHDRYQIVSYDTNTNEQSLFTHTSYNNMEPVAYGDITLWQAWVDNNWEIMLNDGASTVQLTHNGVQDVSPHMRGGYIVWQTQFGDGWRVAVYDQKTKTVEYIKSENGSKIENPRFVLVYDSTNGQGDVQTVGYDLDTKISFKLGSLPAQLPTKLPKPDQTGETRALIQVKQNTREGEQEVLGVPTTSSGNNGTTSTSTHAAGTLDLSSNVSSTTLASTTSSLLATEIVIPSYTSTTTVSQDAFAIPDIVIPPQISTSTN